MVLKPFEYNIIDSVPVEQKIKKKIQINGKMEDMVFIRIPVKDIDRLTKGKSNIELWCYEHYGEPRYLGRWFKVTGYIILDDRTYVHWKLCE